MAAFRRAGARAAHAGQVAGACQALRLVADRGGVDLRRVQRFLARTGRRLVADRGATGSETRPADRRRGRDRGTALTVVAHAAGTALRTARRVRRTRGDRRARRRDDRRGTRRGDEPAARQHRRTTRTARQRRPLTAGTGASHGRAHREADLRTAPGGTREQAFRLVGVDAVRGVLPQQPVQHRLERPRVPRRRHVLRGERGERGDRGRPRERGLALDRGVERGAQRPQVGGRAGCPVPGALGSDVRRRAQDKPGARHVRVAGNGGETEIGQHHTAVAAHQHVARLDVAVHDAGAVGGLQRVQHAQADLGGADRVVRPVGGERVLQRAGRHILHDDPRVGIRPQHVEDTHHVDVVEAGDGPSLTQGTLAHLLPLGGRQSGRGHQFLDGDLTVQDDIGRPPDATHPALTERRDEPVPISDNERGRRRHHAENTWFCRAAAN